jgi:hypothetical protein
MVFVTLFPFLHLVDRIYCPDLTTFVVVGPSS